MTQLIRELQNADYLENINEIQFSLLSHQDIKKGSVADILTPDTYEGNIPKNNGLFDHNMGSIDAAIICPIDEKKAELCPGYFGKIDLALPVFNYHFVTYVEKILKCVCFHCSNLLLDKTDPMILKELENKKNYNRFKKVVELCSKNKKCNFNNGCFALQPTKYSRSKELNNIVKIYGEFSQSSLKDSSKHSNQQLFTPLICYQILKKIKDEDLEFLGLSPKFSRPEWMIITSLAVPPPSVRPSIRQSDNQRSEDDLTYALAMIVKANKLLKGVMDNNTTNKKNIENYQGLLQYHISTYMDNEIPGVHPVGQRSSYRPLKAITQRLKGKEGRLRINIMGKRVDYSARTVISVDPNIDIDQFGVPIKIAMNLTFPEIVTKYNFEKIKKMVLNGPKKYPGAKTVSKGELGNQRNISLKHVDVQKIANELEIGDIVHRHLIDGDHCLFNRQPTLHKMSMMTHRIVILPFNTFRLNVTVCTPYNADFDGDEMNMHIPQSLQTATELSHICSVPENIISPGNSKPCLGIVQDTLIGSYLLTLKNIKLSKQSMNNYLMFLKKYNGNLPKPEFEENGVPYWSGKQLFSLILPDINIKSVKNVEIIHGEIKKGYLDSSSLGGNPAGLIKQIYNAYGTNECVKFLNNTQKLITRWMMDHSFTISFGDSILNEDQRNSIQQIVQKNIKNIDDLIMMAQHGTYANDLDDKLKYLKIDTDIQDHLSTLMKEAEKFVSGSLSKENNFYIAGDKGAGSKGKLVNLLQIMGCVGPQLIWGSRIHNGFTNRTLPHFYKNDIGPDAKGFCRNSYIQGLNPSEVFFHAMGGRTGNIDTAIQTADSGYISRKLIKSAEDLMVHYDMTVRNSSGHIVQFSYGDDNFDPTKLEKVTKIDLIEKTNDQIEKMYKFDSLEDMEYFKNFMTEEAIKEMVDDSNYQGKINLEYKEIVDNRYILRNNYFKNTEAIGDIQTYIPINLFREIPSQLVKFNINNYDLSDLTPAYIIESYNNLMEELVKFLPEKDNNWKLFKIIFKSFISSKRLIYEYRMNKIAFDDLLVIIKKKMLHALISPGEMVGIIGAQTLGEISTQLTLNTFHLAGVGAASLVITEGLPRLKEIIRLTKNLKNKNMTIYLKEEYSNKEKARAIKPKFAYTQIKDLLDSIEILYDNNEGKTSNDEDKEFIQSYKEFSELFDIDNIDSSSMSQWILRLKFDKESLMNRKITIQEIQEAIKENSHNDQEIECIYSDDSANDVILRIRIKLENTENFLEFMRDFEKQLTEFSLRGITDISHVDEEEICILKYNLDGSIKQSKEHILKTNGSNLLDILSHDVVDITRTITNDILEFHEIFGIEGARELIFRQLTSVFPNDKLPNPRHIQMLADIMCYRGILMQIDRHGLNKNPEIGPIAKASFEEVMNILTQAAVFGEKDNMKGVSSNILAGQFCKAGTNCFEILIDEEKMLEKVNQEYINTQGEEVTGQKIDIIYNELYDKKEVDQNVNDDDFEFGFGMENSKEFMLTEKKTSISVVDGKNKKELVKDELTPIENIEDVEDFDIDNVDLEDINEDYTLDTMNTSPINDEETTTTITPSTKKKDTKPSVKKASKESAKTTIKVKKPKKETNKKETKK